MFIAGSVGHVDHFCYDLTLIFFFKEYVHEYLAYLRQIFQVFMFYRRNVSNNVYWLPFTNCELKMPVKAFKLSV